MTLRSLVPTTQYLSGFAVDTQLTQLTLMSSACLISALCCAVPICWRCTYSASHASAFVMNRQQVIRRLEVLAD